MGVASSSSSSSTSSTSSWRVLALLPLLPSLTSSSSPPPCPAVAAVAVSPPSFPFCALKMRRSRSKRNVRIAATMYPSPLRTEAGRLSGGTPRIAERPMQHSFLSAACLKYVRVNSGTPLGPVEGSPATMSWNHNWKSLSVACWASSVNSTSGELTRRQAAQTLKTAVRARGLFGALVWRRRTMRRMIPGMYLSMCAAQDSTHTWASWQAATRSESDEKSASNTLEMIRKMTSVRVGTERKPGVSREM
mmetsp:Transcript_52684/g.120202  ORF Transcript_52684/g.120202 Transcript_52684/m.120202 type:complete len:248 (+) Transcript_52684:510-1253(+)